MGQPAMRARGKATLLRNFRNAFLHFTIQKLSITFDSSLRNMQVKKLTIKTVNSELICDILAYKNL